MIFSNKYPNLKKLTKDRWLVLHPNNDGLKDFTTRLRKMKEKDCNESEMDQEFEEYLMGNTNEERLQDIAKVFCKEKGALGKYEKAGDD